MSNVIVNKEKIDLLANAISNKSGEPLTLTLDEMVSAVDGIETGGGGITPTGNIDITSAGTTDVTNYATATVASGTEGTPTINVGSLWRGERMITASVTNTEGYISGGTHNADGIILSASDFATGSYTITENDTYDVTDTAEVVVQVEPSLQSKTNISPTTSSQTIEADSGYDGLSSVQINAMPSGTEGTPTATKSAVNNHSIAVTPSVTNSAGYISGGTHNGTAVTVSASELVSGSQTLTENGDYNVTNLASVTVSVSGGGGGTVTVGTKTTTLSASASSISFTGLSGNPTSFVITSSADQSTGGTKAVAVAWDGTSFHGMDVTTQAEADTGFTKSYSSGTLTITATTASFQANEYKLVYTYGGSSSDIHTADVQVGSGATSITFSSLSGRPIYYSCVFKSSFSTSSGYQRVIDVVNDGTNTYGHAFDSSAKAQTSWTSSYSGGSLTITSSGTNNGGYFHQPGYYQLTYAVDASAPTYQTKSAYATTSAQTITADNGYDALEQVNLGALSQTNLTAGNIKSGTTVTINNGNANVWSVTGTYSGGGGSLSYDTKTATASDYPTSLSFSSMKGEPKFFAVRLNAQVSSSGSTTYYYIVDIVSNCNGSSATTHGNCFRIGSTRRVDNITSGYSYSYSGTTLTITSSASSRSASPGAFYSGSYELIYAY